MSSEPRTPANASTPRRRRRAESARSRAPADAGQADACIDENVKADLFAKRKQRTTRERLFQQTNRHELTVQGGYYVSDLFDGTYTVGGRVRVSHDRGLAVEASGLVHAADVVGRARAGADFAVLRDKPRRELMFDADLVWVPAHAKMRLGGSITHFDLYVAAGAGVVDSVLSSDIAGNGGFGLKFFLGARLCRPPRRARPRLPPATAVAEDVGQRPDRHVGVSLYLPVTNEALSWPAYDGPRPRRRRPAVARRRLGSPQRRLPAPRGAGPPRRRRTTRPRRQPTRPPPTRRARAAPAAKTQAARAAGAIDLGQAARRIRRAARRAVPRPRARRSWSRRAIYAVEAGRDVALEGRARTSCCTAPDPSGRQRRSGTRAKSRWPTT